MANRKKQTNVVVECVKKPKSLLKKWHETTAQIADTQGQSINAADASRVIKTSMQAAAQLCATMQATELEVVEMVIKELRKAGL